MTTMETGLGGTVSIEVGAVIVAIVSSILLLAAVLAVGRDLVPSLVEVSIGGVVVGVAYYLGLRS
ncbi:MAG: hypothetical protein J07HX5_02038 [halophilic archaeon J07HX5]|jgi:hypothetical protein|nr:MAG: hypothetical protein J07HX5_02038 [halophilic archaeon J07HX5]